MRSRLGRLFETSLLGGVLFMLLPGAPAGAAITPPAGCEVALAGLAVRITASEGQLEVLVQEQELVRARMEVPVDGALLSCRSLDVDGDGKPELLATTAAADPASPSLLRAWKWSGEWFESLALAPLEVSHPLPVGAAEDLRIVGGELIRSFSAPGSSAPLANFRYDFAQMRWKPLQAMRPPGQKQPARNVDDLLQAPAPTSTRAGAMP